MMKALTLLGNGLKAIGMNETNSVSLLLVMLQECASSLSTPIARVSRTSLIATLVPLAGCLGLLFGYGSTRACSLQWLLTF